MITFIAQAQCWGSPDTHVNVNRESSAMGVWYRLSITSDGRTMYVMLPSQIMRSFAKKIANDFSTNEFHHHIEGRYD